MASAARVECASRGLYVGRITGDHTQETHETHETMSTHSKPSHGLRSLLSLRRTQGEREGTRDALESLREPLESRRKSLVRVDSFPTHDPEDTRKAALTRAYAEMFDLSDRFNTETEET
jgi:hypothetical protein